MKDNKIKQIFESDKNKKQIYKLLQALIVCLFLLFAIELIFQIPAVSNAFSTQALETNTGDQVTIWIVLWLLMYAQVTIIPVPAMPIYIFCNRTDLVGGPGLAGLFSFQTLFFVLFVESACIAGAVTAYWLGRVSGKRAIKWIAGDEEEYYLWSRKLNCKWGKYLYSATVILPVFPDDILCLVAGAIGIDFGFFLISNITGRLIGTIGFLIFLRLPYISQFFSTNVGEGFPWALLVYGILLFIVVIITIIWKKKVLNKSV